MGRSVNGKAPRVHKAEASGAGQDPWRAYLDKHHLKRSRAREEVVAVFLKMRGHVDLEQLHARVKLNNPSIGLATVYRALKLMEDAGIVEARRFVDRSAAYEVVAGRAHHDHLVCEGCGTIFEFADPDIERIQEETARAHGFLLLRHRHELFGLCDRCQSARPVGKI